jgi:hypothetical protein
VKTYCYALALTHALALTQLSCASSPTAPPAQPAAQPPAPTATEPPPAATATTIESAREPEPSEEPSQPASEQAPAEAQASDASDQAEEQPEAAAAVPEQLPNEILTVKGVIFMLDYQASALKAADQEKCAKNAEEDPAKLAECVKKRREEFRAGAMRFVKSSGDKLRWVVYRRTGDALKELYAGRFKVEAETNNTITLRAQGGGWGARPVFRGRRDVTIQVPSTYRIVLDDPQFGKLVYKARFGLQEP